MLSRVLKVCVGIALVGSLAGCISFPRSEPVSPESSNSAEVPEPATDVADDLEMEQVQATEEACKILTRAAKRYVKKTTKNPTWGGFAKAWERHTNDILPALDVLDRESEMYQDIYALAKMGAEWKSQLEAGYDQSDLSDDLAVDISVVSGRLATTCGVPALRFEFGD